MANALFTSLCPSVVNSFFVRAFGVVRGLFFLCGITKIDGEKCITKIKRGMGWTMGLEPTTTGITIRGSTN